MESVKKANDVSYYEHFINICSDHGLDASYVRGFMDYQTPSDYLITNTDRHFNNFGILRDSDMLSFVSMAPIYDSGNSMFYKDVGLFSRERMSGSITVTSFARNEAEQMKYVSDAGVLDLSETPSSEEVEEFYLSMGIDEYKAGVISRKYDTKRDIISDFQKGMKFWSYSAWKGGGRNRS